MEYIPEYIDYEQWSKYDYWKLGEALDLAIRYKLSSRQYASNTEYDEFYQKEFEKLYAIVVRGNDAGLTGYVRLEPEYIGTDRLSMDRSVVIPYYFVKWIAKKHYEIPPEFNNIVLTEITRSELYQISDYIKNQVETINVVDDNEIVRHIIYDHDSGLTAKQKRELGMLKSKVMHFEAAIIATAKLIEYLMENTTVIMEHKDLNDFLYKNGYGQFQNYICNYIWKAIPDDRRRGSGWPKGKSRKFVKTDR